LSVFLSYFLGGILAILLGVSSLFYVLLFLVFLLAGVFTFSSGTDKALLVDYVKQNGLNKNLQKIISNITSYASFGGFITMCFSMYLIYLNVRYVWYAMEGLCFIFVSFFSYFMVLKILRGKKGLLYLINLGKLMMYLKKL